MARTAKAGPARQKSQATAARTRGRSKAKAKKREPMSEEARARLREIIALSMMGITLFTLLACMSAYQGKNLCGSTGEGLAVLLLGAFGYASYLLVLCLAVWSVVLFFRIDGESVGLRASGLLLCLVSASALAAHLFGQAERPFPVGGVVGEFINDQLLVAGGLGIIGTRIVLVVLFLITFVLATDIHVYTSLLVGAGFVARKAVGAKEALSQARIDAAEARENARAMREAKLLEARSSAAAVATATRKGRGAKSSELDAGDLSERELAAFEALEGIDGASIPASMLERRLEDELGSSPSRSRSTAKGKRKAKDEPAAKRGLFDAFKTKPGKSGVTAELEDEEDEDEDDRDAELAEDEEWVYEDEDEDEDEEEEEEDEYEEDEYEDEEEDEDEDPADDGPAAESDDLAGDVGLAVAAGAVVVKSKDDLEPPPELNPAGDVVDVELVEQGPYCYPGADLLDDQEEVDQEELDEILTEKTKVLERTLASFKVEARVVEIQKGPVISMFEMELAPGIKVEKVRSLEDDLAIALRARTVRIVAPIPGKNTIGIEVPNPIRESVRLKPLLTSKEFTDHNFALPIFLGRDAAGRAMIVDLAKMPHLLVAGATGSGKSVCLNTIIVSWLFTRSPEQVKLILIDPKMVELSQFENAPHLACPVVSDMKRAPAILEWAVVKMEERYKLLAKAGVRNIYSYNKSGKEGLRDRFGDRVDDPDFPVFLPFIVIVVDELADLMMTSAKEVETSITRLAAKSRAVGIHIILATQRPSTNVITGLIKANLPTRVAFMVSSKIDSRVILDTNGAEQLLGQGDMLFLPPHSSNVVRGQCTFTSEEEVRLVMDTIRSESGPAYEPELVQRRSADRDPTEVDDLYDAATRFIIGTQRGSASLLQRKFAIGYTRASRLIDLMAEEGVLGEYKGSQAREVQMTLEDWVAMNPEARESGDEDEQE